MALVGALIKILIYNILFRLQRLTVGSINLYEIPPLEFRNNRVLCLYTKQILFGRGKERKNKRISILALYIHIQY